MSDKLNELTDLIEDDRQRVTLYKDAELYCPRIDDEEHDANRHIQADGGTSIICLDLPYEKGEN